MIEHKGPTSAYLSGERLQSFLWTGGVLNHSKAKDEIEASRRKGKRIDVCLRDPVSGIWGKVRGICLHRLGNIDGHNAGALTQKNLSKPPCSTSALEDKQVLEVRPKFLT